MKTFSCFCTLEGHLSSVNCLIELKNGELLSGSKDTTMKVWNILKGSCLATLNAHVKEVVILLETINGDLISAGLDGTMRVWKRDF